MVTLTYEIKYKKTLPSICKGGDRTLAVELEAVESLINVLG